MNNADLLIDWLIKSSQPNLSDTHQIHVLLITYNGQVETGHTKWVGYALSSWIFALSFFTFHKSGQRDLSENIDLNQTAPFQSTQCVDYVFSRRVLLPSFCG